MITESEIKGLPLNEKLRVMEWIWADITRDKEDFESPEWHRAELEQTESRRKAGLEQPMDWEEAKRKLLNQQ